MDKLWEHREEYQKHVGPKKQAKKNKQPTNAIELLVEKK